MKERTLTFCKQALRDGRKAFDADPKALDSPGSRTLVMKVDHVLAVLDAIDQSNDKPKQQKLNIEGVTFVDKFSSSK